jgi:hypothetical protein
MTYNNLGQTNKATDAAVLSGLVVLVALAQWGILIVSLVIFTWSGLALLASGIAFWPVFWFVGSLAFILRWILGGISK